MFVGSLNFSVFKTTVILFPLFDITNSIRTPPTCELFQCLKNCFMQLLVRLYKRMQSETA